MLIDMKKMNPLPKKKFTNPKKVEEQNFIDFSPLLQPVVRQLSDYEQFWQPHFILTFKLEYKLIEIECEIVNFLTTTTMSTHTKWCFSLQAGLLTVTTLLINVFGFEEKDETFKF